MRQPGYVRERVLGSISSVGGLGGHGFVVGHWLDTPIGPFSDVMWVNPQGRRLLLAPNELVATFIRSIYAFDETRVGPLLVDRRPRRLLVHGHGLDIELFGGPRRPIPFSRPLAVTRFLEAPIARALMGVRTYGTSPTGAREWYQARGWRWVTSGRVSVDGVDLGAPMPLARRLGVGFSEPPRRPAIVDVAVTIERAAAVGYSGGKIRH